MPFHTECPDCQTDYHLPDEQEGRRVRCKRCGAVFSADPLDSADAGARGAGQRRKRDGDAAEGGSPLKNIPMPWLVGGIVASVGLLTVGAIVIAVILKPSSPQKLAESRSKASETSVAPTPMPMPQPFSAPAPPAPPAVPVTTSAATPVTPQPAATGKAPVVENLSAPGGRGSSDGRMTASARDKVKHATVYIQVTYTDGRQASGSGFFGAVENPNLILTNAHVVGMLAPESHKPKKVEVVLNSGEANMKKTTARVVGVDRHSDLAVLDIGTSDAMPTPLTVKPAAGLQALDPVYIFGFPLGKSLGEEITISTSTVSSLRKRNGILDRVQVNGGMDHGNSGGPVADANGDVVGVAVSGIEGSPNLNFAIPGERVTSILRGRLSSLAVGLPFAESGKVSVPVQMEMIDVNKPSQIKSVAIEVWTGDRGDKLAPSDAAPAPRAGDSAHQRIEMPYSAGIARGEVPLPELPRGKVYWMQPVYTAGGVTQWAGSSMHDFKPEYAIHRKPANLRLHASSMPGRQLSIAMRNSFRPEGEDEGERLAITRTVDCVEKVQSSDATGTTLRAEFGRAKYDLSTKTSKGSSHPVMGVIEPSLGRLVSLLRVDPKGNYLGFALDENRLRAGLTAAGIVTRGARAVSPFPGGVASAEEYIERLKSFATPTQQAMALTAIPLPDEDNCAPGRAWTANEDRPFPVDLIAPPWYQSGAVRLTYTYLGLRSRPGSKPEAVIAMEGVLTNKDGGDSIGGQVTGYGTVDLGSGIATHVELRAVVDLEIQAESKSLRTIATQTIELNRTN